MVPPLRQALRRAVGPRFRTAAASAPVVAVTAPAGYGKTTLLTEWALAEDRTVAWISLDRFDDDPTALLGSIADFTRRGRTHQETSARPSSATGTRRPW